MREYTEQVGLRRALHRAGCGRSLAPTLVALDRGLGTPAAAVTRWKLRQRPGMCRE